MIKHILTAALAFALVGCVDVAVESGSSGNTSASPPRTVQNAPTLPQVSRTQANRNFQAVVARMEPLAERECRRRTDGVNCDFKIVVDDRPNIPPNAFQTLDRSGRPIIGFTASLIADARSRDELALILGHEAAHHIEGHIAKSQNSALGGALAGAVLAGVLGLDASAGQLVTDIGGTVGARRFSKEFELQADALGTVLAAQSGYDPVKGAAFFNRIPDPGDQFLGTHPPNAERVAIIRRTAARL